MSGVPDSFYVVIGTLVLGNLGTFGLILKGVWWLAKAHSRLEVFEKDLDALHFKQRELETKKQGEKENA